MGNTKKPLLEKWGDILNAEDNHDWEKLRKCVFMEPQTSKSQKEYLQRNHKNGGK